MFYLFQRKREMYFRIKDYKEMFSREFIKIACGIHDNQYGVS